MRVQGNHTHQLLAETLYVPVIPHLPGINRRLTEGADCRGILASLPWIAAKRCFGVPLYDLEANLLPREIRLWFQGDKAGVLFAQPGLAIQRDGATTGEVGTRDRASPVV